MNREYIKQKAWLKELFFSINPIILTALVIIFIGAILYLVGPRKNIGDVIYME